MSMRLICFVALSIGHVLAHQLEQQPGESNTSAASSRSACGIELIWPPSDGIVRLATDSLSVAIYLKATGDCSQDVHLNYNSSGSSLKLAFALYAKHIGDMTKTHLQHVHASPLDEDQTPVHNRLMRSPLLVKGQNNNLHYDTSGHHLSKEFSVWCFNVVYNVEMRSTLGLHDLESDHMIFYICCRMWSASLSPVCPCLQARSTSRC
jgi:hypothetical protein